MILAAVFLLSFAALAFEILLPRIFAITQWHHLSFMAISIALFGFAAAGTFLSLPFFAGKGWETRLTDRPGLAALALLFSTGAIASFLVLTRLPLDYFQLPVAPIQYLYLLGIYLCLALPFFVTGLAISAALASLPGRTGLTYAASMAGSAAGALLPYLALPMMGEGRLVLVVSLLPLMLCLFSPVTRRKSFSRVTTVLALGILSGAAWLYLWEGGRLVSISPSPYKGLSQIRQFPDTALVASRNRLQGRVDFIHSPYIRFAPGLSLRYHGRLPRQWALYKDADHRLVFYDTGDPALEVFPGFLLSYAGYALGARPDRALVVQDGGGIAVPCALAAKASHIVIVQRHPDIANAVRGQYGLSVVNQSPRAWLAGNPECFDILHVENWGPSLPGVGALAQGDLFTVEAFGQYMDHLSPRGRVVISRKLKLPPADMIRLWANAYTALARKGIARPDRHLVVLRNWDTASLLVFRRPAPASQVRDWAKSRSFDVVYLSGLARREANRYNVFDAPYHYDELSALAAAFRENTEDTYFRNYVLDVAPQTDHRPFPNHFLKWSRMADLYHTMGSRVYSLFLSGELVVASVLVESLIISLLLLVLPLALVGKSERRPSIGDMGFFFGVGLGFIFTELYFIKKYTFFLGDPATSFTTVLGGMLISSGMGGVYSQRLENSSMVPALCLLVGWLVFLFSAVSLTGDALLSLQQKHRMAVAVMILIPTGFLMGIPFPMGMRCWLQTPGHRAYAWSANGCASVLASVVSIQIGMSQGIPAILMAAMVAYLLAAAFARRKIPGST